MFGVALDGAGGSGLFMLDGASVQTGPDGGRTIALMIKRMIEGSPTANRRQGEQPGQTASAGHVRASEDSTMWRALLTLGAVALALIEAGPLGSAREGRRGRAQLLQRPAQAVDEDVQVREAVGVALDADVELAGIGQHGHTQRDVAGDLHHRERLQQASAQQVQGALGGRARW